MNTGIIISGDDYGCVGAVINNGLEREKYKVSSKDQAHYSAIFKISLLTINQTPTHLNAWLLFKMNTGMYNQYKAWKPVKAEG